VKKQVISPAEAALKKEKDKLVAKKKAEIKALKTMKKAELQ